MNTARFLFAAFALFCLLLTIDCVEDRVSVVLLNSVSSKSLESSLVARLTQNINRAYAEKWGYSYEARFTNFDATILPPCWQRVLDTLQVLCSDMYDNVLYLDLDAAVANHSISVEQILKNVAPSSDIIVGKERKSTERERRKVKSLYVHANTGVFIVRNNEWSKSLLREWLDTCLAAPRFTTGWLKP